MESIIVFHPFRLDPVNEQLWRGTQQLPIRPKPFAVLRYLVEHPGRLITKEELTRAVWSHTAVGESSLKGYIRALRGVLGDDPEVPQFIETVAWRGYRFIGTITGTDKAERSLGTRGRALKPLHLLPTLGPRGYQPARVVGREEELKQLRSWLDTALQGNRGTVFVTGEPGIGKTALVDAFLNRVAVEGNLWVGRGQCLEHYGAGEAYLPVLEALGSLARLPEGRRLVALLHHQAPTWLVQLPALVDEAELEALQRRVQGTTRERMLREMVEALEALAAERLLVLWLEDLQWSDVSTVDLLAALAQRREAARLLVIGTYRPADMIVSGHPLKAVKQELRAHGQCAELPLGCLPAAAVQQYLATRFPQHQFPPALGQRIHQRTDGNPLFMVTVVENCVAQKMIGKVAGQWRLQARLEEISVGIPESLRQLIAKQIERLGAEEQRVLETASVAGTTFSAVAVAVGIERTVEEVEQWCDGLARRGQFLCSEGIETLLDGTLVGYYQFLHALYQQVFYERLSVPQRVRLHRRIAERVEAGYGSRAAEQATELAMHYERGQDSGRAVAYLEHAAQTATQRCAYREALNHLSKGLELLTTLPATPERTQQELRLHLARGVSLLAIQGWAAPELGACYTRARALCQLMGEPPQLFPALYGLWVFHYTRAELPKAQELATQLLTLAEKSQDVALLMEAHHALGNTLHRLGELTAACTHLEQGIVLYDPQQHRSHASLYGLDDGVAGLGYVALVLWTLGYPDQALQRTNEMLTLARALSHPLSLAWALNAAAWHAQLRLEGPVAQEHAEAELALSTEHGFAQLAAVGTIVHGWVLVERGQKTEGIARISQGLAAHQTTGAEIGRPRYLAVLAQAYGTGGQAERGLDLLAEALAAAHRTGERFYEAELYRLQGALLLAQKDKGTQAKGKSGKGAEAEACFHKAIEIAHYQSAKSLELRVVISLSRLWQQQGKKKEARQLLAKIYGWFTEGFETKDLQEAKVLLEELA